jgi:hypothetical protein
VLGIDWGPTGALVVSTPPPDATAGVGANVSLWSKPAVYLPFPIHGSSPGYQLQVTAGGVPAGGQRKLSVLCAFDVGTDHSLPFSRDDNTRLLTLAKPTLDAFVAANPIRVNWPDRRAIGALFPDNFAEWVCPYSGVPPSSSDCAFGNCDCPNPRGWIVGDDQGKGIDIRNATGRADFRLRMIK